MSCVVSFLCIGRVLFVGTRTSVLLAFGQVAVRLERRKRHSLGGNKKGCLRWSGLSLVGPLQVDRIRCCFREGYKVWGEGGKERKTKEANQEQGVRVDE
ncbi:MAG: hypothetical protein J3Q66DRAFT_357708 [Benniella sp.]|nr:MAG: hypothetical protein J3Q66DRAFT_357708 [Benniella sp.]